MELWGVRAGVWNNNPLQTPPADSSTPPGRLAGGSGLSNLSRSRIWLRRKIFFFWPVEVWLLWHVPKASKGCEAVVLVALGRSRGWERGIHGCGTVGGPRGGLEQQPPTNSTSRLQYTAGPDKRKKIFIFRSFWDHPGLGALGGPRRSVGVWLFWHVPKAS